MSATQRFDQAAATWDLQDRRVALAAGVANAIIARMPLSKRQSVLDFGCGTGLVTLALADRVGSITGADTSMGMLKALEEKASTQGIPISLITLDASSPTNLGGPYDLIISSMTLHHVADVPALLRQFMKHLRSDGRVALADLDAEDGSFHGPDVEDVHHQGFARDRIRTWLEESGFRDVQIETATTTVKEGKEFSVFLTTASRI